MGRHCVVGADGPLGAAYVEQADWDQPSEGKEGPVTLLVGPFRKGRLA